MRSQALLAQFLAMYERLVNTAGRDVAPSCGVYDMSNNASMDLMLTSLFLVPFVTCIVVIVSHCVFASEMPQNSGFFHTTLERRL